MGYQMLWYVGPILADQAAGSPKEPQARWVLTGLVTAAYTLQGSLCLVRAQHSGEGS